VLYINFQLLEISVSRTQDDVIDWSLPNKILGCAIAQ